MDMKKARHDCRAFGSFSVLIYCLIEGYLTISFLVTRWFGVVSLTK